MTIHFVKHAAVLAIALSLTACAKDRTIGTASSYTVSALKELPAPTANAPFVINPQEQIQIDVMGVEDISGLYTVDSDGFITFPLIGNVPVGGKTPNQVAQIIMADLRDTYIKDPQVWVNPKEVRPLTISVGGEVTTPGNYPAVEAPSLIHAINSAGGLADLADKKDVIIMRTVGSQNYIGVYSIAAIERGNYENPKIYPGDIITVGYSAKTQWIKELGPIASLLYTTVILYDRLSN